MANGVQAGSSVAAGLEGLVGGFLMGHDLRRQRTFDREDAEERRRLRERQERLDAEAGEDRARTRAVEDLNLRTEHGLSFGPRPKMSVEDLRRRTGEAFKTFGDLEVPGARERFVEGRERRTELGIPEAPEGFHRVGPSAAERDLEIQERAHGLRVSTGQMLADDLGLPVSGESVCPVLAPLALVALVALLGLHDPHLGSFAALVGAVVLLRMP